MDQGGKRSGADVLAIAGNPHAQTLASALRWCWRYEHQQMLSATIPLLDYELPGYLAQHQTLITSVSWGLMLKALLPAGAATMLHMRMHAQDPGLAKTVFMALASGLELTATDPVYTVRERYISMGRALYHTAVVERAAAIVRAWNGRRGGRTMPQGKWVGWSAWLGRKRDLFSRLILVHHLFKLLPLRIIFALRYVSKYAHYKVILGVTANSPALDYGLVPTGVASAQL